MMQERRWSRLGIIAKVDRSVKNFTNIHYMFDCMSGACAHPKRHESVSTPGVCISPPPLPERGWPLAGGEGAGRGRGGVFNLQINNNIICQKYS